MTRLKVYEWEYKEFPWHQQVNIKPDLRAPLARMIAQQYKRDFRVELTTNGNGMAYYWNKWGPLVTLPRPSYRCSLGLICHEVAHQVAYRLGGSKIGHSHAFKIVLIAVMEEMTDGNDTCNEQPESDGPANAESVSIRVRWPPPPDCCRNP